MMPNFVGYPCVFELAVYRVDPETWSRETEEFERRYVLKAPAWKHNDVVGWLLLDTSYRMIKSYLQWRDSGRLLRPTYHACRGFYVHCGKVFEIRYDGEPTHIDIYKTLID